MKITIETLKNLNQSAIMELFYNEFLQYGKKCALYIAHNHDMTIEYCTDYIASGLFELFINRCEKLHSEIDNSDKSLEFSRETMLYSFLGTKKLVKKIMAMTNYSSYFKNNIKAYETSAKTSTIVPRETKYDTIKDYVSIYNETSYKLPKYKKSKNQFSEYRNVKKVNSHIIDIVDILEQKENRTSKKLYSLNTPINDDGDEIGVFIQSYYPSPDEELLNKLSRFYSRKTARKIRSDKKYYRILEIEAKIKQSVKLENSDVDFLHNFKKRNNLDVLTTKELLYIVSNY